MRNRTCTFILSLNLFSLCQPHGRVVVSIVLVVSIRCQERNPHIHTHTPHTRTVSDAKEQEKHEEEKKMVTRRALAVPPSMRDQGRSGACREDPKTPGFAKLRM